MTENRAGVGEGPDAGTDGKARDEDEQSTKTQDLTKAGREDFDPNAETEGGEDEGSTEKEGSDEHLHEDQKTRPM